MDLSVIDPARDEQLFAAGLQRLITSLTSPPPEANRSAST
jgi:hypothetical protein